jgi:hypothetical protein
MARNSIPSCNVHAELCPRKDRSMTKPLLPLGLSVLLLSAPLPGQSSLSPAPQEPKPAGALDSNAVSSQASPAPFQLILLDGTPVKLSINRSVSSGSASVGEQVDFSVKEDVATNGVVVIPKGSLAIGKVTEAVPKRRMGRAGKLEIVLDYVRLADTEKASVRAVKDAKGQNRKGGMTVGIVATGLLFWPAAPLFLLMHGKDITVPQGAEVTAYVNGDQKLEAARFAPKNAVAEASAATPVAVPNQSPMADAAPAAQLSASIAIQSTPAPAAVYADGTLAGNTPANLKLNSGDHQIRILLDGYKEWSQTVHVQGGVDSQITASLEKEPK